MKLNDILVICAIQLSMFFVGLLGTKYYLLSSPTEITQQPYVPPPYVPPQPPPPPPSPSQYDITSFDNTYLKYDDVVELMKSWNKDAPEITEFDTYGKTSKGTSLYYLRIGTPGQPKILIHACLHGNERLSTASTLWIMRKYLHDYGRDEDITWLIKNRDVYFVPVLSADTYLRSRHVEGVDPNRDYPSPRRPDRRSSSPVKRMCELYEKHKFKGVISGHTTGHVYLWPSLCKGDDLEEHRTLAKEMGDLARYSARRIANSEAGYEIDWYYWQGAVAILTEFASGGHNQPSSNIEPEGQRNYKAYMHFIKKAPTIETNPPARTLEKQRNQIIVVPHTYS